MSAFLAIDYVMNVARFISSEPNTTFLKHFKAGIVLCSIKFAHDSRLQAMINSHPLLHFFVH